MIFLFTNLAQLSINSFSKLAPPIGKLLLSNLKQTTAEIRLSLIYLFKNIIYLFKNIENFSKESLKRISSLLIHKIYSHFDI